MPDLVDVRGAARTLLSVGGEPLALAEGARDRLTTIARSDAPVFVTLPEDAAAVGPDGAPVAARGGDLYIRGGVAIVPLQGIITPRGSFLSLLFGGGYGGLEAFKRDLREAVESNDVSAVAIDVHSPGGVVSGVPEAAAEIRALTGEKPIVACVNSLCASAAYWLAAQADEIAITPSGLSGSIGVYITHQDWSGANEQMGVLPTYVYAGRYKVEGNFDEPLGDEARAALQAEVDDFYGQFVDDVAQGRQTTADAVRSGYGEGRVLPAARSVAAGLADRVATLQDVVRDIGQSSSGPAARRRAEVPTPTPSSALPEDVAAQVAEANRNARHPITL